MNKAILMGRLTRDPDIRYTTGANATCIARISVAVDRKIKREGEPTADFFNCTAFGKQGEFAEKYLKKGVKIILTGRIQNDSYTDRHGQKQYTTQILIEELEFAESKNAGSSQEAKAAEQEDKDGFMNIPEGFPDDLPFA